MYRYHNNNLPEVIQELFDKYITIHHHTRNKSNLRHPFGKQEYMYRNFSYMGIYILNYIKSRTQINLSTHCSTFKHSLKEYLLYNDIKLRNN